ncbi:MAG: DUF1127 domain-containing protein [Beijerinckiaceae bacterium]
MTRARTGASGATFSLALARHAWRATRQLVVNLRRRKLVQGLHRLDDRMLADIGLRRSDITSALGSAYNVDPSEHLARLRRDATCIVNNPGVAAGGGRLVRVRAPDAPVVPTGKLDLKPC